MLIKVNPHKCEIVKEPVNEKQINVTECEFEFCEEITDNFVKQAFFTYNDTSYMQIINNNKCTIPYEVLEHEGQVEIGVVAFKLASLRSGEEEIRYNPSPVYIKTLVGSLKDQYENSEPITPTDKEQIEQAITDLENNKQDLLVSGENIKTINNESLLGSGNLEVITDLSDYYTKEEVYNKTEIDNLVGDIETILTTLDVGGGVQ